MGSVNSPPGFRPDIGELTTDNRRIRNGRLPLQRVDQSLELVGLGLASHRIEHTGLHHGHRDLGLVDRQSGVKEALPQLVLKNVVRVVDLPVFSQVGVS